MRHIKMVLVLLGACLVGCRSSPPAIAVTEPAPPAQTPVVAPSDEPARPEPIDRGPAPRPDVSLPFGEPDETIFTEARLASGDGLISRIFAEAMGSSIYWADVAGHGVRTTSIMAWGDTADWSPERDRIAYTDHSRSTPDVYVSGPADRDPPTSLVAGDWGKDQILSLDWHPTQDKWLIVTWANGSPLDQLPQPDYADLKMELHILEEGGAPESIAQLTNVQAARFSPDGKSIIVAQGAGDLDPYLRDKYSELWRMSLTGELEEKIADEVVHRPLVASEHGLVAIATRDRAVAIGLIFIDTDDGVDRIDLPPGGGLIFDVWVGDDEIIVATIPQASPDNRYPKGEFWSISPSTHEWRLLAQWNRNATSKDRDRPGGRIIGRCPATGAVVFLCDYNHPKAFVVREGDEPVEQLLPAEKVTAGQVVQVPIVNLPPPTQIPLTVEGAYTADAFHDGDVSGGGFSVDSFAMAFLVSGRDDAGLTITDERVEFERRKAPLLPVKVYVKFSRQ